MGNVVRLRAWRVGIIALPVQVCYFSIFYLGLKTGRLFGVAQLLVLALALWLYLAYIVLANDLADRKVDAEVGKATIERGHGLNPSYVKLLLVLIVLAGAAAVLVVGGGAVFDALWVVAYAVGTAYSLPPFKLKDRRALGLVADSVMEKPIPVLIVFAFFGYYGIETLVFPVFGELLDAVFKHQARDHDIDVRAGLKTFAVALGKGLSDKIVEAIHFADVLMVVLVFVVVVLEIPEVKTVAAAGLAALILAFAFGSLKFKDFFFHPAPNWSAPIKWDDPPFVVLFNGGFQALLTPALGLALAMKSQAYLPVLVLFLISLAPWLVGYAVVGLVRLKLLGPKASPSQPSLGE